MLDVRTQIGGLPELPRAAARATIQTSLEQKRACFLVGESGCGKSALAKDIGQARYTRVVWIAEGTLDYATAAQFESGAVFVSERGAALSAPGFSRMVERAAVAADLGIKAHAHMLRHACGYKLANDGVDTHSLQAYLGHRNIQNTTRYTALAPGRFKGFWKD
jgi:integrase